MLHQSGVQRIEIIVRKEGGASDNGAKETDVENIGGDGQDTKSLLLGSSNKNRQQRVIKTNVTHALAVTKQIAGLGIEYLVGGLAITHGDQALQDNTQRKVEIVQDFTNIASSAAMGAVYGAWGGPVGAILGATFGLTSSVASTVVKYANREREFNYKLFKENNSIEYQRARANINLTTGRLR